MPIKHLKQQLVHMKITIKLPWNIGHADIDGDWESVSRVPLKMSLFPPCCFTKHSRADQRSSWLPIDSWKIRCWWRHFAVVPHGDHTLKSSNAKCFVFRRSLIYLLSKCIQVEWSFRQQQTEREFLLLTIHNHHLTPAVTTAVALSRHGTSSAPAPWSTLYAFHWTLQFWCEAAELRVKSSHRVDEQLQCSLEHF